MLTGADRIRVAGPPTATTGFRPGRRLVLSENPRQKRQPIRGPDAAYLPLLKRTKDRLSGARGCPCLPLTQPSTPRHPAHALARLASPQSLAYDSDDRSANVTTVGCHLEPCVMLCDTLGCYNPLCNVTPKGIM